MTRPLVQLRTNLGCALLLTPFLLGGYLLVASQLLPRGQSELLCRQQARQELGGVVVGFRRGGAQEARLRLLLPGSPLPRLTQVDCAVAGSGARARAQLVQER